MSTKLETSLHGQVLQDEWVIRQARTKSPGSTGGCHSVGFIADHPDGRKAFVKVMEPTPDPALERNVSITLRHFGE